MCCVRPHVSGLLSQKKWSQKTPFPSSPFVVPFAALERRVSGKRTTESVLLLKESWGRTQLPRRETKKERKFSSSLPVSIAVLRPVAGICATLKYERGNVIQLCPHLLFGFLAE
jgi:hypothetical protein